MTNSMEISDVNGYTEEYYLCLSIGPIGNRYADVSRYQWTNDIDNRGLVNFHRFFRPRAKIYMLVKEETVKQLSFALIDW